VETFRIELLSGIHDRRRFTSGSLALDRYFREQASQDVKRRIAICYVAVHIPTGELAGFYTLAATSVALDALSAEIARKIPHYPLVPAALVGRLAVAKDYQGQGVGGMLLSDALMRAARAELGIYALLVDAKDEKARLFYEHYGFTLLPGGSGRLFLPVATARR